MVRPSSKRRRRIRCADALRPHDHVVWFGDGAGELYSMAATVLADGARRGEKLMFVAEDPDPARLSGVDGLERLIERGQLELLPVDAVYGPGHAFNARAQLETFAGFLMDALAHGYSGIRVVADSTPLASAGDEAFRRWMAWEQLADRFQAASLVTGVCFFDRAALGEDRRADLAALHPVRFTNVAEPPFSFLSEDGAVFVTGRLDAVCADRFRRMLSTAPADGPLLVDVSGAEFVDHHALIALAESASPDRPLRVRGDTQLRELLSFLGLATPHLAFEHDADALPTCAACGDVIGVYEQAVIVHGGVPRVTSRAAEPDLVRRASERYHTACYADR